MDDTMIVLTSDHGDYLGDHWMGEKTFFHDAATRVPLIIYDPSRQADATRGTVCDELVECIDLVPTFVDVAGGDAAALSHILEGRSLLPLLHGRQQGALRGFAICEYDYSMRPAAARLGLSTRDARIFMVATREWKLIHFEGGFRPMLFDLVNDPGELADLGDSGAHRAIVDRLYEQLNGWAKRPSQRTTITDAKLVAGRSAKSRKGVMIGVVEEEDAEPELTLHYRGRKAADLRQHREQSREG